MFISSKVEQCPSKVDRGVDSSSLARPVRVSAVKLSSTRVKLTGEWICRRLPRPVRALFSSKVEQYPSKVDRGVDLSSLARHCEGSVRCPGVDLSALARRSELAVAR